MAFTVTYDGNGSDGGSVPVDGATYNAGASVPTPQPMRRFQNSRKKASASIFQSRYLF